MENPKPRVRWVTRCIALLALAFVLTVLSAWIPAWWMPRPMSSVTVMSDSTNPADPAGIWRDTVPSDWGDRALSTTIIGADRQTPGGSRLADPMLRYMQGDIHGVLVGPLGVGYGTTGKARMLDRYEIGWPIRSMTCEGSADNRPPNGGAIARLYARGIPIPAFKPLGMQPGRHLPVRPIWSRFALALLLWAVVLVALGPAYRVPGRWRLRKRRRRGLCVACGYDLSGIEACPECGADPDQSRSRVRHSTA